MHPSLQKKIEQIRKPKSFYGLKVSQKSASPNPNWHTHWVFLHVYEKHLLDLNHISAFIWHIKQIKRLSTLTRGPDAPGLKAA